MQAEHATLYENIEIRIRHQPSKWGCIRKTIIMTDHTTMLQMTSGIAQVHGVWLAVILCHGELLIRQWMDVLIRQWAVCSRFPQLRRLVMAAWSRIKKTGICKAIRTWRCLESLTMPSIAQNFKNFWELKVMGPFDFLFFGPEMLNDSYGCHDAYTEVLNISLEVPLSKKTNLGLTSLDFNSSLFSRRNNCRSSYLPQLLRPKVGVIRIGGLIF